MAMVPQFEQQDLPQIMPTGPNVDIGSAGQVGRSVEGLGQAAQDYLVKHAEQQNYDYASTQLEDYRTAWTDQRIQRASTAQQSGNYTGYAAGINQDMTNDMEARIANAPSDRAANLLRNSMTRMRDEFVTQSSVFEGDAHKTQWTGNTKSTNDRLAVNALRDPTQADDVYAQGLGNLAGGVAAGLNSGDLDKMKEEWGAQVYGLAAQGDIQKNPQKALDDIDSGFYDNHLKGQQIIDLRRSAVTTLDAQDAEAKRQADEASVQTRGTIDRQVQDNLASLADTGKPVTALNRDQIAAAYPHDPERADAIMEQMNLAQTSYMAKTHIALTSPAEDASVVDSLKPQGQGYAYQAEVQDAVQRAIDAKNRALTADPATYVQQASPAVRDLFVQAEQDPSKLPAAVSAQDAAYDKLGVPSYRRPILPQSVLSGWVSKIMAAPAPLRVSAVTNLAQQYGPDLWPRLLGGLVNAGLPADYEAVAAMPDATAAGALASAIGAGKHALADTIPKADKTEIDSNIDNSADFQSLRRTFGYADGGLEKADQIGQSIKLLAYQYAGTMDPTTASRKAIAALTTDKYSFFDNARVPVGQAAPIETAADGLLSKLKAADLTPEPSPPGAAVTPQLLADAALRGAQNGKWVTNEQDNGLVRLSSSGRPVMLSNGSRLELSFAQALRPTTQLPAAPEPVYDLKGD